MKILNFLLVGCVCSFIQSNLLAQSSFDVNSYQQFLSENQNLESDELLSRFTANHNYYKGNEAPFAIDKVSYLDTVFTEFNLTDAEQQTLLQNHFVVTERLSYNCFGMTLHEIYKKDLPVFITTDAILQALHASYDRILMDIEITILEPQLIKFLESLYLTYPLLKSKYQSNSNLTQALEDIDLYLTVAYSLTGGKGVTPQFTSQENINRILFAIEEEQMKELPLFSERTRKIDFSQFMVRGHYTQEFWDQTEYRTLENYFKTMMWLGRIDFLLTPPPDNPWEPPWTKEEIRRMCLGAFMLNELVKLSGCENLMNSNDEIVSFMVGAADNLTPDELSQIVDSLNFSDANELLNDDSYETFQNALLTSNNSGQKILSNFLLMDPFSTEPDTLPVSFRLMGQKFIIDSYVFSNVVYDRIIYQNQKVWRPLPDPLDVMFVLGNDNALHLLKDELDIYKYSSQLASLRYLVDSYDNDFWESTFYNLWLNSIRALNPTENTNAFPFFMKTAPWQQEKLNTQLASWAQLRHDNLLYAKQSYTGGTACSFPHSFIEPYPEFYKNIAAFATNAMQRFSDDSFTSPIFNWIKIYFTNLNSHMQTLETLAQKELDHVPFTAEEIDFLKKMLFLSGESGAPPFSGWYSDLYYIPQDAAEGDFVIADVHTQPTDQPGNVVGHVLHVGTGKVNLGVFLADSPSNNYEPMCYVGPVMSYYEKVTKDFHRMTDEEWTTQVKQNQVPTRPDWVNIYLADNHGKNLEQGREIPGAPYTNVENISNIKPGEFVVQQNYPNPFNPNTTINYSIPNTDNVSIVVYDVLGKKVSVLVNEEKSAGLHSIKWETQNVPSGLYFCRIQFGKFVRIIKMMLVR
ncbi:DUF3160 domain-containing protein [candidate division KSB1 bacterium]|nr:DUF3160 domain-containing protein [candidate division KSB1 bacterium]